MAVCYSLSTGSRSRSSRSPSLRPPIPGWRYQSLVNSARFDKAGSNEDRRRLWHLPFHFRIRRSVRFADTHFSPRTTSAVRSGLESDAGAVRGGPHKAPGYHRRVSRRPRQSLTIVHRTRTAFPRRSKTSNLVLSRKAFLIIWKPGPPTLIPQACPGSVKRRNLFANSVLARMADCRLTSPGKPRGRILNRASAGRRA